MLFTAVVVTIISMITIGLSNTAYKQLILSSVARDSITAFYQSDIASECALYAENKFDLLIGEKPANVADWDCGGFHLAFSVDGANNGINDNYFLNPISSVISSDDKCFKISINKGVTEELVSTTIVARGYNICNTANMRTVERAVEIRY